MLDLDYRLIRWSNWPPS